MAPAFFYPIVGAVKGISIMKAVSFSSLAVSFHAEATSGHADFEDGGDFIGHGDPHSIDEHDHGAHDHGHEEHGEHEDHGDHEGHEDHEDLEHEHDDMEEHEHGEEGELHGEEEIEGHIDEAELEVAAPGLAGRDRITRNPSRMKETDGKPTEKPNPEGMATVAGKVLKSVATASLMVSAASRLVEQRSKELGLAPWGALSAACVGVRPPPLPRDGGPPRPPPRVVEGDGKRNQDYIPAAVRHAGFVM